jgi:hypothetical protein
LSLLPRFLEQFQQVSFLHLHTCVHIFWIIFTLLPHFHATSDTHWWQPSPIPSTLGRTCSTLLFSDFVEVKDKRFLESFSSLRYIF